MNSKRNPALHPTLQRRPRIYVRPAPIEHMGGHTFAGIQTHGVLIESQSITSESTPVWFSAKVLVVVAHNDHSIPFTQLAN